MPWSSRVLVVVGIMSMMFFADIGSKWLVQNVIMQPPRLIRITPFFNLTLGFNTGVSFGIGRDFFDAYPLVLTFFKLCVTAGLLVWAMLAYSRIERIGLALIGGGALGNAFDRWRQGAVTDFLDLHWEGWHWPTFNLADVGIVAGAVMVVIATTLPPVHVRSQS